METSPPHSYEFQSRSNEINVSAVYYPIGICELVIHKLKLGKCDKCVFVGSYQVDFVHLTFIIPYPHKPENKIKYKGLVLRDSMTLNLTKIVTENNFTFIPLPEGNEEQDIVLR